MPERYDFQDAMMDLHPVRRAASLAKKPGKRHLLGSMKLLDVLFKLEAMSLMRLDGGPDHSATS